MGYHNSLRAYEDCGVHVDQNPWPLDFAPTEIQVEAEPGWKHLRAQV